MAHANFIADFNADFNIDFNIKFNFNSNKNANVNMDIITNAKVNPIVAQAACSLVSILPWTLAAYFQRWPQLNLKAHRMLALIATASFAYYLIDQASIRLLLGSTGPGHVCTPCGFTGRNA
ncbi:hypothetical protein N7508_000932 [Penicillium antarcticum]|uniref:uncharacterized protein n=1 Tax=Penicillium antarcticum TaxID=416450 RepID=UPI0023873BB3|nr:uncharacterized protein N7508_000932 [Penicillium antarcticum]KAJ5320649.1 hypothetical protein N7508_000932 [Penicillium antarcticum]